MQDCKITLEMCSNLVPNLLQVKAVKASKLEWDFRIGRLENPSTTNTESSEMKHTGAIRISIFLCSYAGDRCYMLLPLCKYAQKTVRAKSCWHIHITYHFTSMFSRRDTQSDFFKNSLGMFFLDFREPVDKSVKSLAERASQHTGLKLQ